MELRDRGASAPAEGHRFALTKKVYGGHVNEIFPCFFLIHLDLINFIWGGLQKYNVWGQGHQDPINFIPNQGENWGVIVDPMLIQGD